LHTVEPIRWTSDGVVLLDQRRLPSEVVHHTYTDYRELAAAIKNNQVDVLFVAGPATGQAISSAADANAATTSPAAGIKNRYRRGRRRSLIGAFTS